MTTTTVRPTTAAQRSRFDVERDAQATGRYPALDYLRYTMDAAYWFAVGWEERHYVYHDTADHVLLPTGASAYGFAVYAGDREVEYRTEQVTSKPAIPDMYREYLAAVEDDQ